MTGLLIAATHKSSGKTTFTMGLCAALQARGLVVQPFKKGPDYIDPAWLSEAAGRACINLDFYTMERDELVEKYWQYSADADVRLIEGNKGLYDGLALDGSDSNAALAALLGTPVLLVLDCQGMTRGIAPLLRGYQDFADDIDIVGVVLNKVGGNRHASKLRAAVEYYTDLPVLGMIQNQQACCVQERHLGLIPYYEQQQARDLLDRIVKNYLQQVDVDGILQASKAADVKPKNLSNAPDNGGKKVRVGIARDSAFGFYYADDLTQLRNAGAELVEFRPTADTALPDVDALFIGGGFPETHLPQLQNNQQLRRDIQQFIARDKPVYAECGGLMYLARNVRWRDQRASMVGALPIDITVHERPQGRGYMKLKETNCFPWPSLNNCASREIAAHEFHYAGVDNIDASLQFGYLVQRGNGIDGKHDGIVYRRVLASFAHQRHAVRNPWASRFVDYIRATV